MQSTKRNVHFREQAGSDAPRRVLLVDDDRLVLAMLSQGLRQAGYEIWEASSGEQALEMLATITPDIAVLDVRMPGISGVELAQVLRERSSVPFIFLSAYGDVETVRQATASGAVGYLVKPVDTAQIVPSIEAGLARAQDIAALNRSEANLTAALLTGRETSIALGLLMERHRLSYDQAFEKLRAYARQNRRKINDIAKELINAQEVLDQFSG